MDTDIFFLEEIAKSFITTIEIWDYYFQAIVFYACKSSCTI